MTGRKLCKQCGEKHVRAKGKSRDGLTKRFDCICWQCHRHRHKKTYEGIKKRYGHASKRRRMKYLKADCEHCGFIPKHPIQLQLDHVDGNRANNHPSNFQTLCANCHVLKTLENRDFATPSHQPRPYRWDGEQWLLLSH